MILSRENLIIECDRLRSTNKRLVFTNGCFDVLHAGHVSYLKEARQFGDILIVGLNSDDSVRRLKGAMRPLVPQQDRALLLDELRCVDIVSVFDQDTPIELIHAAKPDVLVKGGDYDPSASDGPSAIVGADFVRGIGGEVKVIPLLAGRSSTNIVDRILEVYSVDR